MVKVEKYRKTTDCDEITAVFAYTDELPRAAGEHYIAYRLAAISYVAGLTNKGTRSVNLLIANPDNGKSITIDTKNM